jgi:hypothetical protein
MIPLVHFSGFHQFLDKIVPDVHTVNYKYKTRADKKYFYEHADNVSFNPLFEKKLCESTANLHTVPEPDWDEKDLKAYLDYSSRINDRHIKDYDPKNLLGLHDKKYNVVPHFRAVKSNVKKWAGSYACKDLLDEIRVNCNIRLNKGFLNKVPQEKEHHKSYIKKIIKETQGRLKNKRGLKDHSYKEPEERDKFILTYQGKKAGRMYVPFYGARYTHLPAHEGAHQFTTHVARFYKKDPQAAQKEFFFEFRDFQLYTVGRMFYTSKNKKRYNMHPEERMATNVGDAAVNYKAGKDIREKQDLYLEQLETLFPQGVSDLYNDTDWSKDKNSGLYQRKPSKLIL